MSWATSRFGLLRRSFKGLKILICAVLFSERDADGKNVYLAAVDYDMGNKKDRRELKPAAARAEDILAGGLLNLAPLAGASAADISAALVSKGIRMQQGVSVKKGEVRLECDVVVCGSGAGGGVAAALLAQAGLRVIVLEKSQWCRAGDMSLMESESMAGMYDSAGFLATDDSAIGIIAGSGLGGGTRVNWCASFRTPQHVRQEWATDHGLPAITSERFTAALDAVCTRLGVHSGVKHNGPNDKLKAGLEALGVHCGEIPRNCDDFTCSGYCAFGCHSGDKQDTAVTWLPDAVAAGARILTGVQVDCILTESQQQQEHGGSDAAQHARKLRATGVRASVTGSGVPTSGASRRSAVQIVITSRYVVSSAGSVHTPALLLRSGISARGNVGANLRVHPATFIYAAFPRNEARIDSWKGAMMTTFSKEMADWEGEGYGPFVSVPQGHPGIYAGLLSWNSGARFRDDLNNIPWMMASLIYQRDSGSGRVTIDAAGNPRLKYWISKHDRESNMRGMELAIRALVAAGAEWVSPANVGPSDPYKPALGSPEALEEYIGRIRSQGIVANQTQVMSAHQMGSSRMGSDPAKSVVDPDGQSWDVAGLFVADASVFPTSTGVNPMVTVEAMSYMIASGIVAMAGKAKIIPVIKSENSSIEQTSQRRVRVT